MPPRRQSQVTLTEIISILKKYEDVIFKDANTTLISVGPTHSVWDAIRGELDNKVTKKSLYTRLKYNQNDILTHLNRKTVQSSVENTDDPKSDCNSSDRNDEQLPDSLSKTFQVHSYITNEDMMDEDNVEPSHLFSSNALQTAERQRLKECREDMGIDDPILVACKMKYFYPYLNTIHDIGYDRFFIHYWTVSEINTYQQYFKLRSCPTISIDATGSLVKQPTLIGGRKTNKILLYEIVLNDKVNGIQLSVGHMLSERHDNNCVNYWLTEWQQSGAPRPKQVIINMSLALLSGVVKAFTPHTTLWKYIQFCYDLLHNEDKVTEKSVPCLVRCDSVHIIKLIRAWVPFKTVDPRVKKFFVQVICQILLSEDIEEVRNLLKHMFWVVNAKNIGREGTCAERGRKYLQRRLIEGKRVPVSLEDVENINYNPVNSYTDQYGSLFSEADADSILASVLHNGSLNINLTEQRKSNPFYMMSYEIAVKCHRDVQDEDEDEGIENLHYLPTIVPHMLNLLAYLPIWSGIMCKRVGFGDNPSSSASVENQFNDLKNRVLKHKTLPLQVDDFLETHILSLSGSVQLGHSYWTGNNIQPESPMSSVHLLEHCYIPLICNEKVYAESGVCITRPQLRSDKNQMSNAATSESCKKNLPKKKKFAIKSTPRKKPVIQNINSPAIIKNIDILQNGSVFRRRAVNVQEGNKIRKYILSNTCAFDSIVQILAVAYCDSDYYCSFVKQNEKNDSLWILIMNLLRDGVTTQTYVMRASIFGEIYSSQILRESVAVVDLGFNIIKLSVEQPADVLLQKLLHKCPSAVLNVWCETCKYQIVTKKVLLDVLVDRNETDEKYLTEKFRESVINFKTSTECMRRRPQTRKRTRPVKCITEQKLEFGPHLFFNIINMHPNFTNVGIDTRVKLEHIPKTWQFEKQSFHFRGVIGTSPSQRRLPSTAIGHYNAICYREPHQIFQLYDDLFENVRKLRCSELVATQIFFYTV